MIMKKLLTGCMVALVILAALTGLAGCDQDKVLYNGRNYLMFSTRFTTMPYRRATRS